MRTTRMAAYGGRAVVLALIAGTLKLVYDLALWQRFRSKRTDVSR